MANLLRNALSKKPLLSSNRYGVSRIIHCNNSSILSISRRKFSTMVKVGDVAPDFTIPDQDGKDIVLSDFRGKANVIIFFYPKDNTAICTKEACSFRDNMAQFNSLDAEVIGISSDDVESHKRFATSNSLEFRLGSDVGGEVRKSFGVPNSLFGTVPGRVTYVLDKQSVVRSIYDSQVFVAKHIQAAKTTLEEIQRES